MLHHVYFIGGAGFVKIGYTNLISKRLAQFQIGSPVELTLLKTIEAGSASAASALEKRLHRKFSAFRHHGEWFTYSSEIRDFIENPLLEESDETPHWGFNGQELLDLINANPTTTFTRKHLAQLLGKNQLTSNEIYSLKKLGQANLITITRAETGARGVLWQYSALLG